MTTASTDVPRLSESGQRGSALYLYTIVLIAAVGGFLFGYDLSLISGAVIFLRMEFALTPFWFGVVTASAVLGCPFGPLAGVWLADNLGRKRTLIIASLLFMALTIGCAAAGGMVGFVVWRFIGGMGVGLASTVSPMYIAEVAPAHLRGRLVVVNQLAAVSGLLLSVFVTYLLSFGGHWRWMFATQGVPVVCLMIGMLLVPETPRWLATVGRYGEALRVLMKINGRTQAEKELKDIQVELGDEPGGFGELLRPGLRLALLIGVLLMVFSQINGVNMILIYTPTLFMEAGIATAPDAILNSVYIDTWITLCTLVAFWLNAHVQPPLDFDLRHDWHGRRTSADVPRLRLPLAAVVYVRGNVRADGGVHFDVGAVELGAALRDISQSRPRQGDVFGNLRHVRFVLRHDEPVSHGAGMVQRPLRQSGWNVLDLSRRLPDVLVVCLAVRARNQGQNAGRDRGVLVAPRWPRLRSLELKP